MTPKGSAQRAMLLTTSFDVAAAGAAMTLAQLMAFSSAQPDPRIALHSLLLSTTAFMLAAAAGLITGGIHRQVWRHMGAPDAIRIVMGMGLATLLFLPVMVVLNGRLVSPVPTLLVALLLWGVALFGGRMIARWRTTKRPMQIFQPLPRDSQTILLVGDSAGWVDVFRRLEWSIGRSRLRILGLIELEAREPGRSVRGVPILGSLNELGDVIEVLRLRYGEAPWVAVTGAARDPKVMVRVLDIASTHRAEIMALGHDETAQALERIEPAHLLARPERTLDLSRVSRLFRGTRVLITGGGGSIGSELARQIAVQAPEALSIVDSSELNLYEIDLDLRRRHADLDLRAHLGDVRDPLRVNTIIAREQPEIVVHAAALKHVPLMERNACEAILTNVAGAINVARAAAACGAKRLVFVSTDKAVDPDNVMGATKRLAEIAVSRIAEEAGIACAIVRFGNVLGSSGSVVPLFEKQIAAGGPVTITDPEATRFFMTIEEASALVLQVATLQQEGGRAELFVLDMGEPVSIRQLAETMIRLKGKVPNIDIEIQTTGLREGEKLHESLVYPHEALLPTEVDGVRRIASRADKDDIFDKKISLLIETARRQDIDEAIRLLGVLVPEYGAGRADRDSRRLA